MPRKVRSLQAFRDKKKGEVTPETILEEIAELVELGKAEEIVYIAIDSKGETAIGWNGNPITAVGLLDYAKLAIIDESVD